MTCDSGRVPRHVPQLVISDLHSLNDLSATTVKDRFQSPLAIFILQIQSISSFIMDSQAQSSSIPIARPDFISVVPTDQLGITILYEKADAKVE